MPLLIAPVGRGLKIARVSGDEKTRRHLESLGLVPNVSISILSLEKGGVIVKVKESRLALDHNIAMGIFVSEEAKA